MFSVLEIIAIIFLVIYCYKLLRFLLYHFYCLVIKSPIDVTKAGKWAVVTGATDGIGKAFAEKFAQLGLNVVLISRTKAKLETVSDDIVSQYKVTTKIIEIDFTSDDEIYDIIEKELDGLDIGVLVNNVGLSSPFPSYFLELEERKLIFDNMIKCNILSAYKMCDIVLPSMISKKRGAIINISSTAAEVPSPLLSMYGGTKAFVSKFTKDLECEYSRHGVTIQCLIPGYVATKMAQISHATLMAPTPENYVASALKTLGIYKYTTGYLPHALLLMSLRSMESISSRFTEFMIQRTMNNVRMRAIRKRNIQSNSEE